MKELVSIEIGFDSAEVLFDTEDGPYIEQLNFDDGDEYEE